MVAVVAALFVVATAPPVSGQTGESLPATVTVDFGARQGQLHRTERFNNFTDGDLWTQTRSDDVAFYNEQGLHGQVYRVWLSGLLNQCSVATGTCNFSPQVHAYLTDASTVSDSILAVIGPPDAIVRGEQPLETLRPLLELVLRNLKEQYPAVRYVEVFNEPDWEYYGQHVRVGGTPTLQPADLYSLYVPFYEAVNEVNTGRRAADRLLVGGPALTSLDPRWMEPFLDSYAADPNPHKRLDFISYHAYLVWDQTYRVPSLNKGNLSVVAAQRAALVALLEERHLSQHIPSFITETGIYPGPAFDAPNPSTNDFIRQAAGLATYSYLYANQPDTYMFNWVFRHQTEYRKDQLVTLRPPHILSAPPGLGTPLPRTFTPYGNMMLMQSMMKDTRVSAVSDTALVDGDNGVYAIASKDQTGASLMVWNWQHVHDQSYQVTIDMSRLPSELRHGPVRQQLFRIDQTTSNYFANPATANLQQVDEHIVTPDKTYRVTVDLDPNAIYLILLEPA